MIAAFYRFLAMRDDKVSIGDLAIMAVHYGFTSADPSWNLYKKADLNDDGIIDIVDLASMGQLILRMIGRLRSGQSVLFVFEIVECMRAYEIAELVGYQDFNSAKCSE